ncbi:MAG: pyridoxamine 5'-phosphate oxidase family protein [Candidatus Hodarchaeales archaeon]|jgi:PPOX class probable F420-dependent enzyme
MNLEDYRDILLEKKSFVQVALVQKNGNPHVTPLWFSMSDQDFKDGLININTAHGRVKARNLKEGTKVALSIQDPDNPYKYLGLIGSIKYVIEGKEAEDHIDLLAKKYLNKDTYPYRQSGEKRIKYKITIENKYGN